LETFAAKKANDMEVFKSWRLNFGHLVVINYAPVFIARDVAVEEAFYTRIHGTHGLTVDYFNIPEKWEELDWIAEMPR
jgi:hypothetical protein